MYNPRDAVIKKEDAKKLYFMGASPMEISKQLKLSVETVRYWIYGPRTRNKMVKPSKKYWLEEREALLKEIDEQRKTVGKAKATRVFLKSLDLIEGCLNSKTGERLQINEAKDLSGIVSNMHKVVQLESGEATDIVAQQGEAFSIQDLKAALSKDAFIDVTKIKDVTPKEEPDERTALIAKLAGKTSK